jgi:hypothetical protein
MQMIPLIVGGVLILAAFVALFLSRDTWRVYHIVIAFFLLVANVLFFYLAARTLDTHRAWRSQVVKFEEMYGQLDQETNKLSGELDGRGEVIVDRHEKPAETPWSIPDWEAELAEAGYGRGRVLTTVGLPKLNPATGGMLVQAGQPVTLAKDTLVYVFQSQPPSPRSIKYKGTGTETGEVTIASPPIVRYLGAFVMASVNGAEIDLVPLYPERRVEVKGPLVIFELPPVDTHKAFAHVSDDDIKKLLLSPPVPPEVVQQYLNDGDGIQDPAKAPKELVESAWRRVRFIKEHMIKDPEFKPAAAPAAPAPAPAGDEVAAEPAGDATSAPDPLASGELRFQENDEAIFDPQTAEALVNKQKVATYVESRPEEKIYSHVYMRRLNDYPAAFRNVRNELIATELSIAELDRQIKAVQESIKLAQESERVRKEEAAKRTADLEKLTFEAETMQKLHDAWTQSAKKAQDAVESLKQSIGSQADELARLLLQAAQATGLRAASR